MWWSRVALILMLAGCGFRPAALPNGEVAFDLPATPIGFDVADRLEHLLGTPRAGAPVLVVDLAVTQDQTVRGQAASLIASATWTLGERSGGVRHFVSYATSGTTVATEAARADAERRLALGLADRLAAAVTAARAAR